MQSPASSLHHAMARKALHGKSSWSGRARAPALCCVPPNGERVVVFARPVCERSGMCVGVRGTETLMRRREGSLSAKEKRREARSLGPRGAFTASFGPPVYPIGTPRGAHAWPTKMAIVTRSSRRTVRTRHAQTAAAYPSARRRPCCTCLIISERVLSVSVGLSASNSAYIPQPATRYKRFLLRWGLGTRRVPIFRSDMHTFRKGSRGAPNGRGILEVDTAGHFDSFPIHPGDARRRLPRQGVAP